MSYSPENGMDDEAEAAARRLPEQIARLRRRIQAAKARLTGQAPDADEASGDFEDEL